MSGDERPITPGEPLVDLSRKEAEEFIGCEYGSDVEGRPEGKVIGVTPAPKLGYTPGVYFVLSPYGAPTQVVRVG